MILADKIINLRKKAGWSQEELAFKLSVSRQAVSKWESAQSIPDMNKILMLSKVFDVSTDYLLKDEMNEEENNPVTNPNFISEYEEKLTPVTMETSNEFLEINEKVAPNIALGVMMCIISPLLWIIFTVLGEERVLYLTENQTSILGVVGGICVIAVAVIIFIVNGSKLSKFKYMKEDAIDTEYGVEGMVMDKRGNYSNSRIRDIAVGVALCILSATPMILVQIFEEQGNAFFKVGVGAMLLFIGIGVFLIVRANIIWEGFDVLQEIRIRNA